MIHVNNILDPFCQTYTFFVYLGETYIITWLTMLEMDESHMDLPASIAANPFDINGGITTLCIREYSSNETPNT